ncbi:hypothetical protein PV08_11961 [Exophiala spinifera]|uniref:Uncharacterized protein n=1 Tax=Exophiala spinifera TaxID=91928 RepID=A0A0D2ATL5_9EURO|nr:uncharacterized protein PV08_11961 [Exophiala spinifera]KIW09860.1 hypothetical protein PV08_11961 [Exophiala spinifera]
MSARASETPSFPECFERTRSTDGKSLPKLLMLNTMPQEETSPDKANIERNLSDSSTLRGLARSGAYSEDVLAPAGQASGLFWGVLWG